MHFNFINSDFFSMPHSYLCVTLLLLLRYFYFLDYGRPTRSRPRERIPVDADNINNSNDSSDGENILTTQVMTLVNNDFSQWCSKR